MGKRFAKEFRCAREIHSETFENLIPHRGHNEAPLNALGCI
jgi:hypothetical protein